MADERTEHEAADQIRRLMIEAGRFNAVSGATAFRRASPKRGWTDAGFFSFERGGELYFVTVESAGQIVEAVHKSHRSTGSMRKTETDG